MATGMMVTMRMFRNIPTMSTATICPAVSFMRKGVIKGASKVEAQVMPTEKATSPWHKYDIMLLDTPPGQHPTSNMPMAMGG